MIKGMIKWFLVRLFHVLVILVLQQGYVVTSLQVSPALIDAAYNASDGNLLLSFSSLINAETLNITGISLQSTQNLTTNSTGTAVVLQGAFNSLKAQGNTTTLLIILKSLDYARVCLSKSLCRSLNTTFVSIEAGCVLSDLGVPNIGTSRQNATTASSFFPDNIPPFFAYYSFNMDIGLLNLTFSEPIEESTFQLHGLTFQREANMKVAPQHRKQQCNLENSGSMVQQLSNYNRTIVASLGYENLNCIKAQMGLCISPESCFLSAYASIVNDTNGNPFSTIGFDYYRGVQPMKYVPDWNSPYLLSWNFDQRNGMISLVFSETVDVAFLNYSSIILTNGINGTTMRVVNPELLTFAPSNVVQFILTPQQFYLMQYHPSFFKTPNTSYIILEQGMVVDTSAYQHKYSSTSATFEDPMRVTFFRVDDVPPELKSFELYSANGTIYFYFSETVNISSFRVRFMTLQSTQNAQLGTEIVNFNSNDVSSVTSSPTGYEVQLVLSSSGRAKIQSCIYLGRSAQYTFVSILRRFVSDTAAIPNAIVEISSSNALEAALVVTDATAPHLEYWAINMTDSVLTLRFSKPLDLTSFQASVITLSSDATIPVLSTTRTYPLEGSLILDSVDSSLTVHIQLSSSGQIYLKSFTDFCSSTENCFISFPSTLAVSAELHNIEGINAEPVKDESLVKCNAVYADDISPELLSFAINMNSPSLSMNFSKPIQSLTSNLTAIELLSSSLTSNNYSSVVLSAYSDVDQGIVNQLQVRLSGQDYSRIIDAAPLCTALSNCKLRLYSNFASDIFGNVVRTVTIPLNASSFIPDQTSPHLISVYLDPLKQVNLTFIFSEPVNISSVNGSCLALASTSGATFPLDQASILTLDNMPTTQLTLSLSALKSRLTLRNVATQQSNTFGYVAIGGCFRDASPQKNVMASMSRLQALRDGLRLLSFRLDLMNGFLDLVLTIPISVSTVRPTSISVKAPFAKYSLTSITSYSSLSGKELLRLYLSQKDIIQLKRISISSRKSVRLSVGANALTDINGKILSSDQTVSCSQLVLDYNPPQVVAFSLDLAVGDLTLTFDRDIVLSTFASTSSVSLSTTNVSSNLSKVIELKHLTLPSGQAEVTSTVRLELNSNSPLTDRELVLIAYPLGSSVHDTYLYIEKGFFYGNSIPAQPSAEVDYLQAATVTADYIPPQLTGFSVDLANRLLFLNFSEAVNTSSFDMSYFTVLADPDDSLSAHVSLSTDSIVLNASSYGPEATVLLGDVDVNAMMSLAPNLSTAAVNCYLACKIGAFYDLGHPANPNVEIAYRYGLQVKKFYNDTTPPQLVGYNISIPDQTLDLIFNEIVSCKTLDTQQILFQPTRFLGLYTDRQYIRLSNSSYCANTINYSLRLHVRISYGDILRIKSTVGVLKSMNTTYLRLLAGAVKDAFGNANEEVMDGYTLAPTAYIPDTTSPILLAYSVTTTPSLVLFFNEPMDASSLQITRIHFQNAQSNPTRQYPLIESRLFRHDRLLMRLEIYFNRDYYRITADSAVLGNATFTYLAWFQDTIKDMAGNDILPMVNGRLPMRVGPSLWAWDLDLEAGCIFLEFTESVQSDFSPKGIAIQTQENITSSSHYDRRVLSTTTSPITLSSTPGGSALVKLVLNSVDLYILKEMAGNSSALFMTMAEGTIMANSPYNLMTNLTNNAIEDSSALIIRYLYEDYSPPTCLSFTLDLNQGQLILLLDEPVVLNSVDLSKFTLFSSFNGSFITLSAGDSKAITLTNYTSLVITLATEALNEVKVAVWRGGLLNRLTLLKGAMKDIAGNLLVEYDAENPVSIGTFIMDSSSPKITSFEVDLSTYQLTVIFDEVVDMRSLSATSFILLNNASVSTSSEQLQLTNYTLLEAVNNEINAITLDLGFLRVDQFALEALDNSFNALNDSFVKVINVSDIFGNALVNGSQIAQATSYVGKQTLVNLEGFDLISVSANVLEAVLYFSNLMTPSNFHCSDWILRSQPLASGSVDVVTFSDSDCTLQTTVSSRSIAFRFTATKIAGTTINQQQSTTYINTVSSTQSEDVYGILLIMFSKEIDISSLSSVSALGIYSSSGNGLYYYLTNGVMVAGYGSSTFNEPVRTSTFNADHITFQSSPNITASGVLSYQLTGGQVSLSLTLLTLTLEQTDAAVLKMTYGLLDGKSTSYFSLIYGAVADYAGNYLSAISSTAARQVDQYVRDEVSPQLELFTLDLSQPTARIRLQFSEPINITAVNLTSIVIQSRYTSTDGVFHRLRGGTTRHPSSTKLGDVIMEIDILEEDFLAMKLIPGLIRNKQSSYLVYGDDLAKDMNGNAVVDYPDGAAKSCDVYIADLTSPQVLQVSFNANNDEIAIVLDEPVVLDSVDVTGLNIIPFRYPNNSFVSQNQIVLTSSSKVLAQGNSELSTTMTIQMSEYDTSRMKSLTNLFALEAKIYFAFKSSFATDFSGNYLQRVPSTDALLCSSYTADTTSPYVTSYSLNMNSGIIQLTLSEAVNMNALNLSEIDMQNLPMKRFGQYVLLSDVVVYLDYTVNQTILSFNISEETILEMKVNSIGTTLTTSYLSWTANFAVDTAGNPLVPAYDASVRGGYPRAPDIFQRDTISPVLSRWFIDRDLIVLHLFFSEPVIVKNMSAILLHGETTLGDRYTYLVYPSQSNTIANYSIYDTKVSINFANNCPMTPYYYDIDPQPSCQSNAPSIYTLLLDNSTSWALSFSDGGNSVVDYANPANSLVLTKQMMEGAPDCSNCSMGQYVIQACSSSSDRVCSPCSTCSTYNHFELSPCSTQQDTVCAACKHCPFGTFIQKSCQQDQDTQCAPCSSCNAMEYISKPCALGKDTMCESCQRCDFDDDHFAREQCVPQPEYFRWADINCCWKNNKRVLCENLLNFANPALIRTIDIAGTDSKN
eukprot:scaffold3290_cov165-Ochromonas_danica.AAC.39